MSKDTIVWNWNEVINKDEFRSDELENGKYYKITRSATYPLLTPWLLTLREHAETITRYLGYYSDVEIAKFDAEMHLRYNGGGK